MFATGMKYALFTLFAAVATAAQAESQSSIIRGSFVPAAEAKALPAQENIGARQTYVFTVAPRETPEEAQKLYGPIATYLSKVTGEKIEFQYTESWLEYQSRMRKEHFDLALDGPHFVGWRTMAIGHTPLIKLPQKHIWVVIANKENKNINSVTDTIGRKICAHEPPNFGTLVLQGMYTNPMRQPILLPIKGWDEAYQGVATGKCVATILPKTHLDKNDPERLMAKVLHEHEPYPNLALSAGPQVNEQMRQKILIGLMSEEGRQVTAEFRKQYAKSADFVEAGMSEFNKAGELLRREVGYWFK